MSARSGFTVLEALITLSMMGTLVFILFEIFATGATGFKVGTGRKDLQSELRRILSPLEKDLRNSSFQSVSCLTRAISVPQRPPEATPTVLVQRDGLCFNGLLKPGSAASYDATTGLPLWDCYICYFATLDQPDGKMVRMLLQDSQPGTANQPFPGLTFASLTSANALANNFRTLGQQVMEFGVSSDPPNQLVQFHLRLRLPAGHQAMGGRSSVEVLEIQTVVFPGNTYPRL